MFTDKKSTAPKKVTDKSKDLSKKSGQKKTNSKKVNKNKSIINKKSLLISKSISNSQVKGSALNKPKLSVPGAGKKPSMLVSKSHNTCSSHSDDLNDGHEQAILDEPVVNIDDVHTKTIKSTAVKSFSKSILSKPKLGVISGVKKIPCAGSGIKSILNRI